LLATSLLSHLFLQRSGFRCQDVEGYVSTETAATAYITMPYRCIIRFK
jgi:hypothetical protein